ncbi:hypothetical protein ACKLNO_02085 [Neisseriaceae bacterium B1]
MGFKGFRLPEMGYSLKLAILTENEVSVRKRILVALNFISGSLKRLQNLLYRHSRACGNPTLIFSFYFL